MTAIFSQTLTVLPTITPLGGVITSSLYNGTTVTFNWIPTSIGIATFQFNNVSGTSNTLTSNNVTVFAQTTLVSLLPNSATLNVKTPMTAIFTNNIISVSPTIVSSSSNDIIDGIVYTNNNVTFNWTPTSIGIITFQINNLTGNAGIVTSNNITVYSTTTIISVTPLNNTNIYNGIQTLITVIFSEILTSIPIITILPDTGIISGESYIGTTTTFNWTPITSGSIIFQFNNVTGTQDTIIYSNIVVLPTTKILSIIPNTVTNNNTQLMTVTFNNTIVTSPTIIMVPNTGTITNINYINNNVTFNWTPLSTGTITFQFTNVSGCVNTLTWNNIMVYSTTVFISISPISNIYNGMSNKMTVIFSESVSALPVITPLYNNGVINGTSYLGNTITYNWTPIATGTTYFQYSNVTGSSGILTSTNIDILPQTTIISIIPNITTINVINPVTVFFNNNISQSPTIIITETNNGIINNINYLKNNLTFNWTPNTVGTTNFQFNNIPGTLGILISENITVSTSTELIILSSIDSIYNGIETIMTATFSQLIETLPTVIIPSGNGIISEINYFENNVLFNWIPNSTGIFNFQFDNVTGNSNTIISNNIIVLPQTLLLSILPITVTTGIYTQITAIFTNVLTNVPTININNGDIDTIDYNNNNVTFNWTPTSIETITFQFSNVTGNSGIIISDNITIYSTTVLYSITPIAPPGNWQSQFPGDLYSNIYNGIQVNMMALFSEPLLSIPTITPMSNNGIVSGSNYLNNSVTFDWTPIASGTLNFQFSNVTGGSGTLLSNNITVLETTIIISTTPKTMTIGVLTPMTVVFNNNILTIPIITPPNNNGTINNINYNNNNVTFNWTPESTGTGTFQFTNIMGNTGTLISSNITVYSTTVILSITPVNNIYNGIPVQMIVNFSEILTVLPVITVNPNNLNNGTISGINYSNTQVIFTWVPNASGIITFSFTNITGTSDTLISDNINIAAQTTLVSLLPNTVTNNILTQMIAIFTNNIMTAPPTIIPVSGNGTITNIYYINNNVTFNWTPTSIGTETFQFGNITGTLETIISSNITIVSTITIMSIQENTSMYINGPIPVYPLNNIYNIYNGIITQITVVFSELLTSLPTIISSYNTDIISGETYTKNILVFNWLPTVQEQ